MEQMEFPPRYEATNVESKWYAAWDKANLFAPSPDTTKKPYCITIPPPNITGSLHMGHALCYPLQDVLGRYQRLLGKRVLILPGQDHAGIATQSVVEKQLRKEGSSGAQLGREKFVERVWQWREESGSTILNQFKALGCAFDWSRLRFTLDEHYAQTVLHVFVDWYNEGFIYRGKRVVNWDPKLKTSVSDIETLREVRKGHLYHIRYDFVDGSGSIVIATTRPETMLADIAVAVHPSDKRYEGKIGKKLRLPLVGREIPLIADLYPDPEFGTGAVKITPAHDPNDYEVGARHNLAMPVALDLDARISAAWNREFEPEFVSAIEKYEGMDRYEARKQIVADLEEAGVLVEIKDHEIPIIISDRSGEVIEPLLSEQWFARQGELAKPVIEAVQKDEVKFTPARYKDIFLAWMESIRDWNISRQLWWGHRVPAFYTEDGDVFVAVSWEEAQKTAGDKPIVRQDDDVLDTWFSSGMWPFVTLGWPEATEDMKTFYPTDVLITDRNIINLWVARMLMMGYDLVGEKPFGDVMIYATVMREDGRRMSKSLGTGIDPMGVIETLGADALRWTLLSQTGENQELRYSDKKTQDARNFCNKIWNATRFVLMNVDSVPSRPENLQTVDKWLLSRLVATEKEVRAAYDRFDLQSACQALYRFFWSEVCDWYIEISKSRLQDDAQKRTPQWVLLTAFDAFLKMLHPVMPFITEELYSRLPLEGKSPFIMAADWPALGDDLAHAEAEQEIEAVFAATRALRALRAEIDLKPLQQVETVFYEGDLKGNEGIVSSQAWVQSLQSGRPSGRFVSATSGGLDFHIAVEGLIDLDKVLESIKRDLEKSAKDAAGLQSRLDNPQFVERAKPEIIERDRALLEELNQRMEKLKARQALLEA
ncbi:MAG: valine--tRNA ligase [Armatimonadetes bacterium]|nr:valine--tRNA ligase [Armatimonadota bacterium]